MRTDVSALYVDPRGPYPKLVADWWDEKRDARKYSGPSPVVAHPPCERWGRYWGGGPMLAGTAKQKILGADGGCFAAAVRAVEQFGGVIEHPEGSHAFEQFGLGRPRWREGWAEHNGEGLVCCVAQGNYGHESRKLTWLYYIGDNKPPELNWSIPRGLKRLEDGHDPRRGERVRSSRIATFARLETPAPFAALLLELAAHARI